MNSLVGFLLSYLLLYKYAALFVITLLAGIIVPFPVSALALAVGAFSVEGYFNFFGALLAAAGGNIVGDVIGYGLAKKYGMPIVHKLKADRSRFFRQLEEYLRKHAGTTIFVTRFAGSLDPVVNFLSGLANIPLLTFLFFDALGNTLETFLILYVGAAFGTYWENISNSVNLIEGIVVVVVLLVIFRRLYKKLSTRRQKNAP